jgi:hypothetical protein
MVTTVDAATAENQHRAPVGTKAPAPVFVRCAWKFRTRPAFHVAAQLRRAGGKAVPPGRAENAGGDHQGVGLAAAAVGAVAATRARCRAALIASGGWRYTARRRSCRRQ